MLLSKQPSSVYAEQKCIRAMPATQKTTLEVIEWDHLSHFSHVLPTCQLLAISLCAKCMPGAHRKLKLVTKR